MLGRAQISLRRRRVLEGEGRDGALPTQSELQSFIYTHFTHTWAATQPLDLCFFFIREIWRLLGGFEYSLSLTFKRLGLRS